MSSEIRKINLDDPSAFDSVKINEKYLVDDFGKEIKILVREKNKNNFYGAYRTKDILGGNMINVNTYHLFREENIENFGADSNFVENDVHTGEAYSEYNIWMKEHGI